MPADQVRFEKAYQDSLQVTVRKPTGLKIDGYIERHKEILYRYDFGDGWEFVI